MTSIWQSANELLDALRVYERQCLFYEPKDPRRDAQYREAARAYADAAAAFVDWKRSFLTAAVTAHAEAEAEERLT
jgi:hypothetical protein